MFPQSSSCNSPPTRLMVGFQLTNSHCTFAIHTVFSESSSSCHEQKLNKLALEHNSRICSIIQCKQWARLCDHTYLISGNNQVKIIIWFDMFTCTVVMWEWKNWVYVIQSSISFQVHVVKVPFFLIIPSTWCHLTWRLRRSGLSLCWTCKVGKTCTLLFNIQ